MNIRNIFIFLIFIVLIILFFIFLKKDTDSVRVEKGNIYRIDDNIMQGNITLIVKKSERREDVITTNISGTTAYSFESPKGFIVIPLSILNKSGKVIKPNASMFILEEADSGKEYTSIYKTEMNSNLISGKQSVFFQELFPREISYETYVLFEAPIRLEKSILVIRNSFFGGGKDVKVQLE